MTMSRIRLLLAGAIVVAGVTMVAVVRAQQPAAAEDPRFTGVSTVLESKELSVARPRNHDIR